MSPNEGYSRRVSADRGRRTSLRVLLQSPITDHRSPPQDASHPAVAFKWPTSSLPVLQFSHCKSSCRPLDFRSCARAKYVAKRSGVKTFVQSAAPATDCWPEQIATLPTVDTRRARRAERIAGGRVRSTASKDRSHHRTVPAVQFDPIVPHLPNLVRARLLENPWQARRTAGSLRWPASLSNGGAESHESWCARLLPAYRSER